MRSTFLAIALTCAMAAPAAAQQLTVAFNDGLVTIDATSVPVRTILNEWAKKGGTKVVGVERVSGAPLTLKLMDVPEAKALDVILRSVAGYMAAPRSTGDGASRYDRILVMATSSTPPPVAPARPQPNPAMNGTQRFIPPQRQTNDDEETAEEDQNPPNPPVFSFPGAPGQPNVQPGFQPPNLPPNLQQMIVNPGNANMPPTITINPAQPGGYPTVAPFGSSTPGVITQPPPVTPGTRPPGGRQQQQ
jgi:hypothetical protein